MKKTTCTCRSAGPPSLYLSCNEGPGNMGSGMLMRLKADGTDAISWSVSRGPVGRNDISRWHKAKENLLIVSKWGYLFCIYM